MGIKNTDFDAVFEFLTFIYCMQKFSTYNFLGGFFTFFNGFELNIKFDILR